MDPQNPHPPQVPPTPAQPPTFPVVPPAETPPPPVVFPAGQPLPGPPPFNPAFKPLTDESPQVSTVAQPKPKGNSSRKPLIWFVLLVIFSVICFAPLVPGVVIADLPGNTDDLDTGGPSTVNCGILEDAATTSDEVDYQNKKGVPLSYNYAKVVTTSYTCDRSSGKQFLGSTSLVITNWTAVVVDAVSALLLATLTGLLVNKLGRSSSK